MKNYYEILEVNPKASDEIIKKIYKIKVKQNHPDLFQGEEKTKAEEITKEITEAYDILSDPQKRQNYDNELSQENKINYNELSKYENIISSLKSENEYLKDVITSKNNLINNFLTTQNIYPPPTNTDNSLFQNELKNFSSKITKPTAKSTSGKDYFNYILFDLKQLGFKLFIFFAIILALLSLLWLFTGRNIYEILF